MKTNPMLKGESSPVVEPWLVDIHTASKLLNVCPRTIRNLTRRGELPVVRIGSSVRYRPQDLTDFIQRQVGR